MELEVALTARQLELVREARDLDSPGQPVEEFIVAAFVADAEREQLAAGSGDGNP